jgi:tetratricopeptide (TPR) repeat protein
LQPNNALARQFCGWVYRRRGEWERSIANVQRAGELDPRDAQIPANLGATYVTLRQWKDAERAGLRALGIDPHNVIAASIVAMPRLNATGDVDSARRAFAEIPMGSQAGPQSFQGDVTAIIGVRAYLYVTERRFSDAFQTLAGRS